MKVKILRQKSPESMPYWQEFHYERNNEQTIVGLLDELNSIDNLRDVNGELAPRIDWECSCHQGMCGACAMVVNGRPVLACETFIRDIKKDIIVIEPLSKFSTIHDLVVDRSSMEDNLKKAYAFIEENKESNPKYFAQLYSVGKCIQCGLCQEVCPNYKSGEKFFGASFANNCFFIASRSKTREKEIRESYEKHFENGCSKSLSCSEVCPMNIITLTSIARMNRGK